jgi:hypothetical protein
MAGTMSADRELLTTSRAARALGIDAWQVARLFERGLFEEPPRLGRFRMIGRDDLPRLREAAIRAGYLSADTAAVAAAGQPQPTSAA